MAPFSIRASRPGTCRSVGAPAGGAAGRGAGARAPQALSSNAARQVRGRADIESGTVEEAPGLTPALRPLLTVLLATIVVVGSGCASRPLLERAIRARGGPPPPLVRQAEAAVQGGFPGPWQGRPVFRAPDDYAWSTVTAAGTDHYLFDGSVTRAFIGGRQVSADASQSAPLRAH